MTATITVDYRIIQKYGAFICKKCGNHYRKRNKSKTSNPNQCGTCNRIDSINKNRREPTQ